MSRIVLLKIEDVVHGTWKWQWKFSRRDMAVMRRPVSIGTTPELRHDQRSVQLGSNDERTPRLHP